MSDLKEEKPKSAKATTITNRKEEEVPQPDNSPLKLPPEGKGEIVGEDESKLVPNWNETARENAARILAEKAKLENPTKLK